MAIQRSGKFFLWEDAPLCPSLGIETENIVACIREINKKRYEGIFGCPVFGFKQDNLNFLIDIKHIRYIHFWEIDLNNVDAIYHLKNLEYFSISPKRPSVDFSKLPKLEKIIWHHKKTDSGISNLENLKRLNLWRYKIPSYENLKIPNTLEYFEANWSDPEDLFGLPVLKNLKELQLHYCRNLKSLTGLKNIAPNLEKLVITRCKNCTDIEEIKILPNLQYVWIQDKKLV